MNILIIKIGALGDVVRCSFIAQALRDKYRKFDPKIYWITDKRAISLFVNNPYVHSVLSAEKKGKLKTIPFDLVVNLEEDAENARFVSSLKPRKIRGFFYKDGKILPTKTAEEWFNMSALGENPMNDILKKKNKKTHRQIMGEIIQVNYNKYEPFLRLTEQQRKLANDFLRRHNLSRRELIVGINTGGADRWAKSLSIEKTVELINRIYNNSKAKILLFGGPNEIGRNREIARLSKAHVIDTGCGNDLVEFPSLISVCGLFITTDSLGLHIALALKRKTICLFGPTSNSEIDMHGLGEKVIAKSSCLCCYTSTCKSMEKINIDKVMQKVEKVMERKITLLITSYKEPKIAKAIEAALNQKTDYDCDIFVCAPDKETIEIAKKYAEKNKKVKIFRDPGKGKSYALNLAFKEINSDILFLTDGDVTISSNAVEEIANIFLDPEIGCVTGRPVPVENRKTKYGYWAHFLMDAAHNIRKNAFEKNSFIECSGYIFAFLKSKINKIPTDVAEDTIIPYYFWEKGYKIGYADKAEAHVKNPDNIKDWIKQKIRTSKAHGKLSIYADIKITPKVKTFANESKGIFLIFSHPKNPKEFFWAVELVFARLYIWLRSFLDTRIRKKHYSDAWEKIKSAR